MESAPPRDLSEWTTSVLGANPRFSPCGWPQGPSRVWRLEREGAPCLYLKQFGEERKRAQEVAALEGWVEALRGGETALPQLYAKSDPALSSILLTAVPGEIAANLPLDEHAGVAIHRRAGEFLARLHALPFRDEDPMPLATALPLRLAFWLERQDGLLSSVEHELALRSVGDGAMFEGDTRVPCHRDYSLRNWLVEGEGRNGARRFGVIDFEHARPDHPWVDFVRVEERARPHYPAWFESFCEGYSHASESPITACDAKLRAVSAIHAVGSIVWGHTHGDAAFERSGHALLQRLRLESR